MYDHQNGRGWFGGGPAPEKFKDWKARPQKSTREEFMRELDRERRLERLELTEDLIGDVAAGIRVLNARGLADLDEAEVEERARGIVSGLLENYRIRRRP